MSVNNGESRRFPNTKEGIVEAEAYDKSRGGAGFWEQYVDSDTTSHLANAEVTTVETVEISPGIIATRGAAVAMAKAERTIEEVEVDPRVIVNSPSALVRPQDTVRLEKGIT